MLEWLFNLNEKYLMVRRRKHKQTEKQSDILQGIIKLHHRGFGFVKPDNPALYEQDIFIPKHLTLSAVDGDHVEIAVDPHHISEKGPEGKVTAILKRARTHIAGIICSVEYQGDTLAYVPILGTERRVVVQSSKELNLRVGDRVIMEVLEWGSRRTETVCRATSRIGHISDPKTDILAAVEEFDLREAFPAEALREAKQYGTKVTQKDIEGRKDLRRHSSITIDPDTAKDFDDALDVRKDSKGNYHLGVHIADVSHYVPPDSALDIEAMERSNSTYFPGYCVPMLPPALSENLCSLRPAVNRLAVSVLMTFDKTGELKAYEVCRSVIKSKKRFTYNEAKKVLDGKVTSPFTKSLHLMVELCKLLKTQRYARGSIEFAMPEFVVKVDEEGVPVGTEFVPYDITHQLVEEFMLKANEVIALHLSKQGKDLTYRIHEEPSSDNMNDFVSLAEAFGFKLPDNPNPKDLQGLFDEALNTPYGSFLATSYIRRMRLAMYSPENIGHYGLGLTHYCHFTSPIRRYIDLVVHRILFGGDFAYDHLESIAQHCSEQERISERAEQSVILLKKIRLLQSLVAKDPHRQFQAVVTKVRNFGFFFEVIDLMLEGYLHVSELEDDYYEYSEAKSLLKGVHTGKTFFAGDSLTVLAKEIDLVLQHVKWNFVSDSRGKKKRKFKKRRR